MAKCFSMIHGRPAEQFQTHFQGRSQTLNLGWAREEHNISSFFLILRLFSPIFPQFFIFFLNVVSWWAARPPRKALTAPLLTFPSFILLIQKCPCSVSDYCTSGTWHHDFRDSLMVPSIPTVVSARFRATVGEVEGHSTIKLFATYLSILHIPILLF